MAYFPSYEIVMDELRDYRFYNEDMLHPNQLAIDYIWEKFTSVWIHKNSKAIMDEVDAIQKGLAHRPFNAKSDAYQRFLSDLTNKIKKLRLNYKHIQF